ncbi:coniferyl-alcohol dehydrogenase [Blastomonas sp.]|uniref:coniferyl-alcohol dehydrogenase n=1 Tax=Blastomonas sp. TaxID=1909299 RepID=UPI00262F99D5|nr:coniferyl-alcohol dehydrogenase [Blastomonas sp.]MDM7956647.1 coniferyl-alcohol dehydrogenase [Blastomonas sp.]
MSDIWSYVGKRVVIAGCFSGMGEACARELVRLGAEVHGVDIKPSPVGLASFTQVDLKDTAAIEAAVEAIGGEVDAVFNCAGLPQTFPAQDVVQVNFIGIRHWTNQWIPRIREGGAVVTVSSNAAMNYHARLALLQEFIAIDDPAAAMEWVKAHADAVADGYGFSKEALVVWTQQRAVDLIKRGIRINATLPSPTATPMMKDFEVVAGPKILEIFALPSGRQSTAEEQAWPLIFLNSPAAGFISGVCLPVDGAFTGGVNTGLINVPALIAAAMQPAS